MSNLRKFLEFIYPFKRKLLACLALTMFFTILNLTPPLLLKVLVDEVITPANWGVLPLIIFAMIAIHGARAAVNGLNTYMIGLVGQKLIFDVRSSIYQHLQSLSMRFFSDMSTGAVLQRIMNDVNSVRRAITRQTISLVTDGVACLFAISVCFALNWRMALVVVIIMPLYVLNYRFFVKRIRDANYNYREKMDGICGILQERLSAPAMVKSFSREKAETRQFVGDTRETLDIARDSVTYSTSFSTASSMISGFGSSIIYCLGCYMVVQGKMEYGSVIAFVSYGTQLFGPAVRFSEMFNMIEQVKVSLDRIFELLDVKPDIVDKPEPLSVKRLKGHVEFDDVTFSYIEGEPVLKNINLDIEPGKLVALVGHTGSGKTTIASLLFRFYDVQQGHILIDGTDIRDIRRNELRRNLGIVLQDTILFNQTIRENIAYGKPSASDEAIIEAAKIAEIHSYIESLPEGYDMLIGPGGVKFSAGQSQRLAIARAVLTDPAILVLDEATSSLDTESEELIQQALNKVMKGRTCFVIAHRLSTIVNADMIVVLDKGKIVEKGKHIDLLRKKGGHYRELCKEQFASLMVTGGKEKDEPKPEEAKRACIRQTG